MKIDCRRVFRIIGILTGFILAFLLVNYIMAHLPDFIRSLKK